MAIGAIHLTWLRHLKANNAFDGLNTIIDFGPQDIQLEQNVLEDALCRLIEEEQLRSVLNSIYSSGQINRDAQAGFYGLFGFNRYESLDADDDRATYKVNLNEPDVRLSEYDAVTNFGTTEHVFNIGEAFKTIHNLTKPGGLSLHCVPCFAFVNHGFYNVHPNLFIEIVRANKYELVDFSYFDNAFVRNSQLGRKGIASFDLKSLPIKLSDMESTQLFMNKVVARFYRNILARETKREIAALNTAPGKHLAEYPSSDFNICFVFDLIFVAMRRPRERLQFVMPMQNPAGVAPLDGMTFAPHESASATAADEFENPRRSILQRLVGHIRRI